MAPAPETLGLYSNRRLENGVSARAYWTFALTEAAAFIVRLHVLVFDPPLEQLPDQIASRPLLTLSVTA